MENDHQLEKLLIVKQILLVQQKTGIARPPPDSSWGSQFDNGEDTREILDTSLQKTNKESDKWVRWV